MPSSIFQYVTGVIAIASAVGITACVKEEKESRRNNSSPLEAPTTMIVIGAASVAISISSRTWVRPSSKSLPLRQQSRSNQPEQQL
ncbi:hypothetical protein BCR39DRAFT_518727 [Naematelia encephala]|uniref:Uncharacterized protein n=1 Tax=Naematelia encephala TaxID=71784 RepID=A0A1Y2BFX2_9TREE|nr:hypothetical protein BCR39DRAFT_518727 [Naematelia encephala]